MKLATRNNNTRDGELLVVSQDNTKAVLATEVAPHLQAVMDNWGELSTKLETIYSDLNAGNRSDAFDVNVEDLHSPLPRAYGWIDGSAYINHIVLVRKARGAEPPATLRTDPLVYQGGSDTFLTPTQDIPLVDEAHGCDFESEIALIMDDTPLGVKAEDVGKYVRLVMLCNDVSLRGLIPGELAKGFGFFTSKPSSAFSPFAVTPDELGDAWKEGRVHLPLITHYNGEKYGDPDAGPEMFFSFYQIIEHVCKTRSLSAGTIVGSGTISNEDRARGSSCLAEKRMIEKIDTGEFVTPFMKPGDTVSIEMFQNEKSIFGKISQKVVKHQA